jgi:peptidoglycan-N-acetylglucosamine deacetylase
VVENIQKHNACFKRIINEGHKVGNHTFNHLNGWKHTDELYLANSARADQSILAHLKEDQNSLYRSSTTGKKLFRPPYGKIKRSQINMLNKEYEIVMWDVLTGDFDKKLPPEKCLEKAIRYTKNGSIVIFHDSIKAMPNLSYALPRFLDYFTKLGYRFETL